MIATPIGAVASAPSALNGVPVIACRIETLARRRMDEIVADRSLAAYPLKTEGHPGGVVEALEVAKTVTATKTSIRRLNERAKPDLVKIALAARRGMKQVVPSAKETLYDGPYAFSILLSHTGKMRDGFCC